MAAQAEEVTPPQQPQSTAAQVDLQALALMALSEDRAQQAVLGLHPELELQVPMVLQVQIIMQAVAVPVAVTHAVLTLLQATAAMEASQEVAVVEVVLVYARAAVTTW